MCTTPGVWFRLCFLLTHLLSLYNQCHMYSCVMRPNYEMSTQRVCLADTLVPHSKYETCFSKLHPMRFKYKNRLTPSMRTHPCCRLFSLLPFSHKICVGSFCTQQQQILSQHLYCSRCLLSPSRLLSHTHRVCNRFRFLTLFY